MSTRRFIQFVFGLLLSAIAALVFSNKAFADCNQPVIHNDGKSCSFFSVQITVQDETSQPVYGELIQLNLSNGDTLYGLTDRAGIYVFTVPEIWGAESVELVSGQEYKGWAQSSAWGANCDWFNFTMVAYPIEEAQPAMSVLTTPVGNVSNSNIVSNVVSGPNSAGFNYSNGNWTNTGQVTYGDTIYITASVNITNIVVEDANERKEMKKQEPRVPVSPPPAPKPIAPRYDLDVHDRHSPVLETHPVLTTPEEFIVLLIWSFYEWLMRMWPFVGVVLTAMGAIVLYWLLS